MEPGEVFIVARIWLDSYKVMSAIKPRHAVGYHFFNEQATHDEVLNGDRQVYAGPLSLAVDWVRHGAAFFPVQGMTSLSRE